LKLPSLARSFTSSTMYVFCFVAVSTDQISQIVEHMENETSIDNYDEIATLDEPPNTPERDLPSVIVTDKHGKVFSYPEMLPTYVRRSGFWFEVCFELDHAVAAFAEMRSAGLHSDDPELPAS